jgi:hypothetical protein
MTPAGPGAGNINGPGGVQNPFQPNPGVGNINGPGGTQNPFQPNPGAGQINGPGGINPFAQTQPVVNGPGNINGPGGIQNPNPGLPKPFPSTPFPGMIGGQQSSYPANQATSNPYMQQFRQPQQQPQQMPANPYNPYQNDWNWNQSGQFPGNRFPAY